MFVLSDYHFGIVKSNEKTGISEIKNKKGGIMNNIQLGMTLPTCEILVNGQKRKLYGKSKNKVYLHNGDNFQLKLFNPLQERIGVQLRMNGIKVDNDLLILSPGQDITIERFIGTNRKLTFSTYEIDATNKEAVKAIEKNGVLEVVFWNEKKAAPIVFTTNTTTTTINVPNPYYTIPYITPIPNTPITNPYYTEPYNTNVCSTIISGATMSITGGDVQINGNLTINGSLEVNKKYTTSGTSGSSGNSGVTGYSGSKGSQGVAGTPGLPHYKSTNVNYSNNIGLGTSTPTSSLDFMSFDTENTNSRVYEPNKIETGRIEKGAQSNQYFSSISFEVGEEFYKIKFKLLPVSLKPVKKNSMTQQL